MGDVWIAILSLQELARLTAEAIAEAKRVGETWAGGETWDEFLDFGPGDSHSPDSLPAFAMLRREEVDGVKYAFWQFLEMPTALRLTGFAPTCRFCNFGRIVVIAATGGKQCTHCSREIV